MCEKMVEFLANAENNSFNIRLDDDAIINTFSEGQWSHKNGASLVINYDMSAGRKVR